MIGAPSYVDVTEAAAYGNLIAHNDRAIAVRGQAREQAFRANRIRHNRQVSVDLGADGVTANDPGDADAGPNRLQNSPEIDVDATHFDVESGLVEVRYRVDSSVSESTYPLIVDFYLRKGPGHEYDEMIGSDVYLEESAGQYRTASIEPVPGVVIEGELVAIATDSLGNSSERSPQAVPVPEPSGVATIVAGIALLGGLGRARRGADRELGRDHRDDLLPHFADELRTRVGPSIDRRALTDPRHDRARLCA